jgi:TRAP-type C4-dicarboxylate transport system permease small subunit
VSDHRAARRSLAERALDLAERVVSWGAGLALLAVVVTIFVNATGRYLAGWSFLGGEELARLLTVWITFVGAFAAVRTGGHVNIDLVLRAVPRPAQRLFRGLAGAVGLATMVYLAWTAWQLSAFSFGTGQMGTTLPVPRGLFFLPVVVGAILMAIAFAEILWRAAANTLPPLPALMEEEVVGEMAAEAGADADADAGTAPGRGNG